MFLVYSSLRGSWKEENSLGTRYFSTVTLKKKGQGTFNVSKWLVAVLWLFTFSTSYENLIPLHWIIFNWNFVQYHMICLWEVDNVKFQQNPKGNSSPDLLMVLSVATFFGFHDTFQNRNPIFFCVHLQGKLSNYSSLPLRLFEPFHDFLGNTIAQKLNLQLLLLASKKWLAGKDALQFETLRE